MNTLLSNSQKTLIKPSLPKSYSNLEYWHKKNYYYYRSIDSIYRFLIPEGQRVLEIGSGTGSLLNAVKPSYGMGIEIVAEISEAAQDRFPHLYWKTADIEDLDIDETFDYIILSDTISYFHDIQKAFQKIRSACTESTRLIISFHNPTWNPILKLAVTLKQKMPTAPLNWLSYEDISNLLELSGFEVIKHSSRLILPKNIPILTSILNRFIAPLPGFNKLGLVNFIVARLNPYESSIKDKKTTKNLFCNNSSA